jgi:hypothetical protein
MALISPGCEPSKRRLNQRSLAYVYSRANEAKAIQAKVLTGVEARRVAANIAKLPALLTRED